MPDLGELGRHALLVVAIAALSGAGWRLAATATNEHLARALATAAFAGAAMVLWTLALALAGLSSSRWLLFAGALVTWAVAERVAPEPEGPGVRRWWRATPRRERAGVVAAVFALAAWALWQLRHPYVSLDGLTYHTALVASWMPDGNAGAATPLLEGVPVGNYPITHEVLVAWLSGLAGSWAPAIVVGPALAALLATAVWVGLRALGADRAATVLALVALLSLPLVAGALNSVSTDLPALTWFAVAGALAAAAWSGGARRSDTAAPPGAGAGAPGLLPFAVLAAGLAVGTKTTSVVLVGAVLVLAGWALRDRLPVRPLALALVAAAALAVVWPVRNLLDHGSPLWPFQAWPGGDPVPPAFAAIDDAFADHPGAMLDGRVDDYLRTLAGGALLLAGALVLPLLSRDRRALGAAAVTFVALVAWANAPYTGIATNTDLATGATRYLLPCLGAAVVAVALSARGRTRVPALVVLGGAALWSLARDAQIGFPLMPSAGLLAFAAVVGVAVAYLTPAFAVRLAVVPVAAWLVLAVAAPRITERHATMGLPDQALMAALVADPDFDGDGREVAMAPATVGLTAGDRLQHHLQLIGQRESCASVDSRLERGWVVLQSSPRTPTYTRLRACLRGLRPVHRDPVYELFRR
jgi:hypothetical protein